MKLSIIIPTKGRQSIFQRTLRSAQQAIVGLHAEIIVVNDDKSLTLEVDGPATVSITSPGSGVASARNAGAKIARGFLLLFLDNDILITSDSLRKILEVHRLNRNIALNPNWEYPPELLANARTTPLGRFIERNDMNSFRGWYGRSRWKEEELFVSNAIASFHLSIERTDFLRSGGYNEQFPHAGFEDYDFPIRLSEMGVALLIDSRTTVYHNEEDRLDIEAWLMNQERRACTRKRATIIGYPELALSYSMKKEMILRALLSASPAIKWMLRNWTNSILMDSLYFKLLGFLEAAYIYKGYSETGAKIGQKTNVSPSQSS